MMDVSQKIEETLAFLELEIDTLRELITEQTFTETKYRLEKAQALMMASINQELKNADARNAWAEQETIDSLSPYLNAKGRVQAQIERTRTLRDMLSGYQSLLKLGTI